MEVDLGEANAALHSTEFKLLQAYCGRRKKGPRLLSQRTIVVKVDPPPFQNIKTKNGPVKIAHQEGPIGEGHRRGRMITPLV